MLKGDPEDTIGEPDAGPVSLDHRGELLPEGEVLEQELPPRTTKRTKPPDNHCCKTKHGRARLPSSTRTVNDFSANGILATDSVPGAYGSGAGGRQALTPSCSGDGPVLRQDHRT